MNASASDTRIANSYRNVDMEYLDMDATFASIFFSPTEEGALKFTVTINDELYYGVADKIHGNIYSCLFDDTGYIYFHFIGDSLFVFEEQHVNFRTPTFMGNYKMQIE